MESSSSSSSQQQRFPYTPSHPKAKIDWKWALLMVFEIYINIRLLSFRWSSLTLATVGWGFGEVVRLLATLFKAFQLLMPIKRAPIRLNTLLDPKDYPTVDVMIPCYNEPVEVRF